MARHFSIYLLLTFTCLWAGAQTYNPVANPAAVVIQGHARFTVLTDKMLRMEYAANDSFTDNATLTFVNRNLPVPDFKVDHNSGWLQIKTTHLVLRYKENSGKFSAGNLQIAYVDTFAADRKIAADHFTWKPGTSDKQNMKGTTRTLDGALGKFSFKGMKKLPIEDGIISRSGWAFIDDSQGPLFDHSDWPWVMGRNNSSAQDWYFFGYGTNYKRALYDFTSTSGHISLPPRYAFGIWYSRYWRYSEQDMKDIVSDYEKNDIPLDVLVVDMDWHMTETTSPEIFKQYSPKPNGWTGFTWEKKLFPDYHEFLKWTDDNRLQTCLNLHPAAGVQPHEAAYGAFAKAMGVDTTHHPTIPFDITNKKFAQAYFDVLLHPYEKAGVDFWWLDWQQWGNTNIKGVNPTFFLNYVHYSDMQRQGKRPLIFHRYGGLGNQRYQIGFSGDCIINWKSLTYQPEFTYTAANVGFGFWSHDIGGHTNPISKKDKQDPELFTRWVQWGAFSPIFRTHATNDPEIERRIWKYPDANFKAMRKAIQQRYALLPYIYTYAHEAYITGVSLVHPLYYEYPKMQQCYDYKQQYYFGDDMIVAPITEPMHGQDKIVGAVWLPEGDWYDYRNAVIQTGPVLTSDIYGLDEIPVYVKAGSIIPTQTAKHRVTGSAMDTLLLTVYPYNVYAKGTAERNDSAIVEQQASFNLYEDDGTTENYKQNICSYTRFTYNRGGDNNFLTIEPDGKTFTGQVQERCYQISIVHSTKPRLITFNTQPTIEGYDWSYDAAKKVLTIHLPRQKLGKVVIRL